MMPVRFQAITRFPASDCGRCPPGDTSLERGPYFGCSGAEWLLPERAFRPGCPVPALFEIGVKSWCAGAKANKRVLVCRL